MHNTVPNVGICKTSLNIDFIQQRINRTKERTNEPALKLLNGPLYPHCGTISLSITVMHSEESLPRSLGFVLGDYSFERKFDDGEV